jgi:hypothetical protein
MKETDPMKSPGLARLVTTTGDLQRWVAGHHENSSHAMTNALLNLAAARLLADEGPQRAATILLRLAEALRTGAPPEPQRAVNLTQLDA